MRTIGWTAAMLAAGLATVLGQEAARAQNANVYDWRDHQPTAGEVDQQERAAGIASQQQMQSTTSQVEQLEQQVLHDAQVPTGAAAGCSPNQKACP